ncbi:hypothetical protein [Microvirga guangxiensis]|uniref:Uncharacterized protein n=1 Tax=Microvirga guangxiensis TaxID=549386 RepID=A0A1G5KDN3_9HYPH|nr:hypothetical protein [Microvirga guangxiensis]SCY98361.1 hypothetical protein SAMN02927923_03218 [Microvirga guangxiensis]
MALDVLSGGGSSGVMIAAEGDDVSTRPLIQGETPARARSLIMEGSPNAVDQQAPCSECGKEPLPPVQTVAFADAPASGKADQDPFDNPPLPNGSAEMRAALKQEPTQHQPIAHELKSDRREDSRSSFRAGLEDTAQQAIRVWAPRFQAASERARGASGRVKVWAQERAARRTRKSDEAQGSTNPVYLLAAITLGIPALLLIPLVGLNPGVQEGTFATVVAILVGSAFVTAAVFEIKRLADQSSDEEEH